MYPLRLGFLVFIFSLSFSACSKKDKEAQDVVITSFTDHAQGGATITITGSGFSDQIAENKVSINGQPATVTAATSNSLSVTVPMKAGKGKISVSVGAKNSISTNDFIYDWVYMVSTLAGDGTNTIFERPTGLATDGAGNIYFADEFKHKIIKITPDGTVSVLAGSGVSGYKEGNGTNAQFAGPAGVAVDGNGNVYVADRSNHRIRKITPAGEVSTWAGNGTVTDFDLPTGICFDNTGNLIVSDQAKAKIIRVSTNPDGTRSLTTVAGSTTGYADGNAATAKFDWPIDVAVDGNGNILVSDLGNHRIRKISTAGIVTTVAGDGTSATLQSPIGIDVDNKGNIYVSDQDNYDLRKITFATDGTAALSTIAGTGENGYSDGIGSVAKFKKPLGLALDKNGNIYIGEGDASRIRKIISQ